MDLQRTWDAAVCASVAQRLCGQANDGDRARLLAVASKGSGSWLRALPSSALGLLLSDEEVRISVGLRLGAPIVRAHKCGCGAAVSTDGHHGLACKRSAGRLLRHRLANDTLLRAFRGCEVPAELEPPRLSRGDGKRPDGATLIPWAHGKSLVWDFTCPDTLAPSHLQNSSLAAGSAASGAEDAKRRKYANLMVHHTFVPVAVETLGAWGEDALALTAELGSRTARLTGEPRSVEFLRQRLDIAIQRGNAASVRGTMSASVVCGQEDL